MRSSIQFERTIELRKGSRYQIDAPVEFIWASPNGTLQAGQGITRDINGTGVYVRAKVFPAAGSRIQLDILLPKFRDVGHGMQLNGEGVVVRMDTDGGGFAAQVHFALETPGGHQSQFKGVFQVI